MVRLDFELSRTPIASLASTDLRSATEMEVRYSCFLGDLEFVVQGLDVSARWGWVPLIDYALAMRSICRELSEVGARSVFEFTESEATISFERPDGRVVVSSNFVDGAGEVEYIDFVAEVDSFIARVLHAALQRHPEFESNPLVERLR